MNNEERLREYVNSDTTYQDFKKGKDVFSDFDMFCIEHCKDIEEMLEKVKRLEDDLYAANQCVNELLDVQEKHKLAIEYCNNNIEYCDRLADVIDILR